MLMGALFADAMHRETMPAIFTQSVDDSLHAYVRIFLRGIGVASEPIAQQGRTSRKHGNPSSLTSE